MLPHESFVGDLGYIGVDGVEAPTKPVGRPRTRAEKDMNNFIAYVVFYFIFTHTSKKDCPHPAPPPTSHPYLSLQVVSCHYRTCVRPNETI